MDCETFFALVDDRLGAVPGRARERVGDRCLVDFLHPATRDRVGDGVAVSGFYRSGVVWHPVGRLLSVELRVPGDCDAEADAALDAAPGDHERSAHRPATTADGDVLAVVHHRLRCPGADEATVRRALDGVAAALRTDDGRDRGRTGRGRRRELRQPRPYGGP